MPPQLRLDGKVAFVTGSSRGIGWASAKALARAGASVVLHGKSDAQLLSSRVSELQSMGGHGASFDSFCFDISAPQTVRDCYREIFRRFKRLDVLVNNAGVMNGAVIGMMTDTDVRMTFDVNALSAIVNTQEAARLMMRNKSGSIINVTSIMATQGGEGYAAYSAAKAALLGLTAASAKELAPRNIRVNAVAPGLILTDMVRSLPEDQIRKSAEKIKLGRIGEPDDVANTVLFLASEMSSYITGQVIGVDGGMRL